MKRETGSIEQSRLPGDGGAAGRAAEGVPAPGDGSVLMAHGGGGELTARLIEEFILGRFSNERLDRLGDSAVLPAMRGRPCLTTDSFVVQPLEFPGGDIGRLAVCGTVNDLAVSGARPKALSLALVMEEGLRFERLARILDSVAAAADEAGVQVVTGDTKVVEKGRGDGLIINTSGLGELADGVELGPEFVKPGDAVIVTGGLAEHGLAVMSAREGLAFRTRIVSDVAPLNGLVFELLDSGVPVRFMRDPTRGGLAGVLNELASASGLGVEIEEAALPVTPAVRHTAELLGLDPLVVANEGKVVLVVDGSEAERVVETCRSHRYGRAAAVIGTVTDREPPIVELCTRVGGRRIVQRPYGEELPRIC